MITFVSSVVIFAVAAGWLRRTLPFQNVAMIMGVLMVAEFGFGTHWQRLHFQCANLFWWPGVVVVLRMGIRWVMRRAGLANYGIWLVAATGALTALLEKPFTPANVVLRFLWAALLLLALAPWFISKLPYQPHDQT